MVNCFPRREALNQGIIWCCKSLQGSSLPSLGSSRALDPCLCFCSLQAGLCIIPCLGCAGLLLLWDQSVVWASLWSPVCALLIVMVMGLLKDFVGKLNTCGIFCLQFEPSWGWRWLAAASCRNRHRCFFSLLPEHF